MKNNTILTTLLEIEKLVKERATQEIVISPALIERDGIGIIRKGTINSIQGRFGSHKSRLGEGFCSLLLEGSCQSEFLGFKRKTDEAITVCYFDTERNTQEEFPQSIKNILANACNSENSNFRLTSLKKIERKERLTALKSFLNEVRKTSTNHLFVVLDVVTDCISNFNDPSESLELYDYIGNLTENNNATFLLIIHENPGSDKARGHLGTEGTNKASTVFSIGFEKNKSNEETDLIRLKFVKLRSAKKPENIYIKYNETQKGLVLANTSEVQSVLSDRRQKADNEEIAEFLGEFMSEPKSYSQQEIINAIKEKFQCSIGTTKDRLREIEQSHFEIYNIEQQPCTLQCKTENGKPTNYKLVAIPAEQLELIF
jgi:hypothetical protein